MEKLTKVAVLCNEIEAGALDALLDEHSIPHIIRSYHDAAFDGAFQLQKGWGRIDAPERYHPEILRLLEELRAGVDALDEEDE